MKPSIKAVVFSAIVFPGAGYFIVNKTARGSAAIAITISCMVFIMVDVDHRANIIAEKIVYGEIVYEFPFDIAVIREQVLLTPGNLSQEVISNISIVIGLIWVVSIVDGYFIG
ncbi:MAG: hypothetical protein KAQ67_08160, partial [Gammaproteobacteria bacterium]|nr:hypothetical protein [Gammaproteobacteria bacterium]